MNLVLTDLIKEQVCQCLVMGGAGIAFMLAYQAFLFLSHRLALGKWERAGLELLFWLAAAVMVWQFLYYCAYGRLSVHGLAAFTAGVLLWKIYFCDIIASTKEKYAAQKRRIQGTEKRYGKKKKKQSI